MSKLLIEAFRSKGFQVTTDPQWSADRLKIYGRNDKDQLRTWLETCSKLLKAYGGSLDVSQMYYRQADQLMKCWRLVFKTEGTQEEVTQKLVASLKSSGVRYMTYNQLNEEGPEEIVARIRGSRSLDPSLHRGKGAVEFKGER